MYQEQLIKLLEPHKQKITTTKNWDIYSNNKNLPNSSKLIKKYGTWNNLKKALDLPINNTSFTEQEMYEIIMENKDKIRTMKSWDKYAKEKSLPSSRKLLVTFGSWSKVKSFAGTERERKPKYNKERIKNILQEHASNYQNRHQWDIYARKNKLPTYKTIRTYYDYDEIINITGEEKRSRYNKVDLTKIALKYQDTFFPSSMKKWDEFALERNLPRSSVYFKHFGSWREAKQSIKESLKS